MAWPVYKPPSGIPASGIPAGGTAAFAFERKPPRAWSSTEQPPEEAKAAGRMTVEEYKKRLLEKMDKVLGAYDTALDSPLDNVRLNAALAIERRLYGEAKQTVEVQQDGRTEAEILESIEAKKRAVGLG